MNFLDAAYHVLRESQTPLHYTEITNQAISKNILDTKGQTPEASMASRLYTDTKKETSRFRRISKSVFALKEPPSSEIANKIKSINENVRKQLKAELHKMPPDQFEIFIGQLLESLGFLSDSIEVTSYKKDGGIDIRGVMSIGGVSEINAAVQVKRWKKNVQSRDVQSLRGALTVHEVGIIVTTSTFSKGAIKESTAPGKTRINLIDGNKLLDLLFKQQIGVTAEKYEIFTLDELFDNSKPNSTASHLVEDKRKIDIEFPVKISAPVHDNLIEAVLLNRKGKIKYNGKLYASPSGAGKAASNWKSCNGWQLWKFENPETKTWQSIEALREVAQKKVKPEK